MAADNQMDPAELASLVGPVARGEVDYAKANRLITGEAWTLIPHSALPRQRHPLAADEDRLGLLARRRLAGRLHRALARDARPLDLERIYRALRLPERHARAPERLDARVRDVPSRPIYGVGERSGIKIRKVVPRIAWLLFKGFWWRLREKYVIRDFHPLVFFYVLGS